LIVLELDIQNKPNLLACQSFNNISKMLIKQNINLNKLYIFILWLILTGININKAFTIDDTYHLEAANLIAQNPLKPMSGFINWGDSPAQLFYGNQPPLFFYIISAYQHYFSNSEMSMHILLSFFTFLSLLYFLKLANFLKVNALLTITTIFAFSPAFIINQNLMIDVPILSLSLAMIYYLLKGQRSNNIKYYLITSLLLSLALLFKYSTAPLFFVILITILTTKSPQKSIILIIPLIALLSWSIWNFFEFGFSHISNVISKPKNDFTIMKLISSIFGFVSTLGALSAFTPIFLYNIFPQKTIRYTIIFIFSLSLFFVPIVYFKIIEESFFNYALKFIFLINGLFLITFILFNFIKDFFEKKEYFKTPYFIIIIYILAISTFLVLFAPFNATRHILLLIPFILLFSNKYFEVTQGIINTLVVIISILLGLLLGISDWVYSDFYRKHATNIAYNHSRVWSIGHWGWQWYSVKAGMLIYSKDNELNVRNGDLIVTPINISKQELSKEIKLDTVSFITETPTFFTFFSGKNNASLYISSFNRPVWNLSNATIDTIFIFKVKHEIGIEDIINRIRLDEFWLKNIKNKSKETNLSIDSLIFLEAKLYINQKRLK